MPVLQMPSPLKDPAVAARQRRDEYVESNLHLVKQIARRVKQTHRQLDLEDLRGAGYIGLIQAAERYTRAHNTAFQTFAHSRIQGEMLELARRRQLRENSNVSLTPVPEMQSEIQVEDLTAGQVVAAIDTKQRVAAILNRLTDRERAIVVAYYLQDRTLKSVGQEFGVSTSQAGRTVRSIVRRANRLEMRPAARRQIVTDEMVAA